MSASSPAGSIEKPGQEVGELVACRAVDLPVLAKRLMRREDFFHEQIERPRRLLAEPQAIGFGSNSPSM